MDKAKESFIVGLLAAPMILMVVVAIIVPLALYNGWALHLCWNWLMPQTFGLPPLSIGTSIGIVTVAGLIHRSGHGSSSKDKTTGEKCATIAGYLVSPLIAILIVWIVKPA